MTTATAGAYRQIAYTSFNLPDSQIGLTGAPGAPQYTWQYDEAHQRVKEVRTGPTGTRTTWMMHPDNANSLSFESEETAGVVSNRHYLSVGGASIGVLVSNGALPGLSNGQTAPATLQAATFSKVEYWHKDHLGSLIATTDHSGATTERYAYDPFGKRRYIDGNYDAAGAIVADWNRTNKGTDRGYTGHEHLDDVGVIHMNGRIYDSTLGMFMQTDPFIQDPTNLQNLNRYGYCYNNPMTCTDPSGRLSLFGHKILPGLFNNKNIRIVAAIGAAVFLGPGGLAWGEFGVLGGLTEDALLQTAISGFVSGSIASGSIKGGIQGAFTAMAFYGAGNLITSNEWGTAASAATHGVVGCVTSAAGGGNCGAGALSAGFSNAVSKTDFMETRLENGDRLTGTLVSSVVGGTTSVLGGGKFANGAQTAAFGYLFNHWAHNLALALDGIDAHQALQGKMYEEGMVVERHCAGGLCLDDSDRFDIADPQTKQLWEIKRLSTRGMYLGEKVLKDYTDNTGFFRGGDLPGLKVGEITTIRGEKQWYTYVNAGNGLILYSPDENRVRLRIPHPFPLPGPKTDPNLDPSKF